MAPDGTGVVMFGGTNGWAFHQNGGHTDPNGPGHLRDTWTWRNGAWSEERPQRSLPPAEDATQTKSFSNGAEIKVPLPPPPPGCPEPNGCPADTAEPYPSPISVELDGKVADVKVTLKGVTYTEYGPNDADIMLVAPDGKAVMIMSDSCGDDNLINVDLVFEDAAPGPLPEFTRQCATRARGGQSFRPTDREGGESTPFHGPDAFSPPAPATSHSASLAHFRGSDPDGDWSLYVVDDTPNDPNPQGAAGRIAGGWELKITTSESPIPAPTPVAAPPPRGRAAMAYHPPSGKVVLYGGTQEKTTWWETNPELESTLGEPFRALGDTWIWDPAAKTWAQQGSGAHPGERRSAAMAYHPGSEQLVLFGGSPEYWGAVAYPLGCRKGACYDDDIPLNDTWTWDPGGWARQSSPMGPPGVRVAGMARSSSGAAVLVLGLGEASATWAWDPRISLRLESSTLRADGASTTTAVATVLDSDGNPITGLTGIGFSSDGDLAFSAVTERGGGSYAATVVASKSWGFETVSVNTRVGSASATLEELGAPCSPPPVTTAPGTWTAPGQVADVPTPRSNMGAATGATGVSTPSGVPLVFESPDRYLEGFTVRPTPSRPTILAPTPGPSSRPCRREAERRWRWQRRATVAST